MREAMERAKFALLCSDMLATRLWLAFGSLIWAALLFWPGDLFDGSRQTYVVMARMGDEWAWAALFLLNGLAALTTLLLPVRNRLFLILDAFLGCALWTAATLACFAAHFNGWASYNPPAAMSAEVVAMLASWLHLIRYWAEEGARNACRC